MKTNTLLAAARLAYPEYEWHLVNGNILREGGGEFGLAGISYQEDAYALWKALAEKRVVIWKDGLWHATIAYEDEDLVTECETDIDAMLSAVEALEAMK